MGNGTLIAIMKILGLLMAIFSIVLYAELNLPERLILWIPISIGYFLWFSDLKMN